MMEIVVLVPGQGEDAEFRDVDVVPGSRALDVLRAVDLPAEQFRLCKPGGGFYRVTDEVYPDVANNPGMKLEVVPGRMEAGAGVSPALRFLRRALRPAAKAATRDQQLRVAARPEPVAVGRTAFPFWVERAWREVEPRHYVGRYRVNGKLYAGDIDMREQPPDIRIHQPPSALSRHPHWRCFVRLPGHPGWFRIHLTRAPADVDDAIHGVENLVAEAFAITGGQ